MICASQIEGDSAADRSLAMIVDLWIAFRANSFSKNVLEGVTYYPIIFAHHFSFDFAMYKMIGIFCNNLAMLLNLYQ